jgi:glycosyltransferase involved in cell wall biosynthesis
LAHAIHVVAGLEAADGGPSYSIPRLCQALAAAGTRTTLLSVAGAGEGSRETAQDNYSDRRFPWDYANAPILRELRCSSGLGRALREAAAAGDIVHNHGLWLMPNVQSGRAAVRAGKPFVVSPRGMLAPAALVFSRLKKRAFWRLLQAPVVRRAVCLHATSEAEYREIRAFGLRNPVAVIPNGIDLPEQPATRGSGDDRERIVLSLGRIHPKKGLDRLLHAWARLEPVHPSWRLRIVGPSEDRYADALRALALSLGLARASVEGPLYAGAKQAAYAAADLFVLPSLNENFGLTVAEALSAGIPVVASKGTPWSGLDAERCGWWVEDSTDALAAALTRAMAMPCEVLQAMGRRGQAWMAREFSWNRVARDMTHVYGWLARGGPRPDAVRLD